MNFYALIVLMGLSALHPVHVSYTNLDIAPETGEVSAVCKFYTDDLKLLFYHFYEREIAFDPDQELAADEIELVSRHLLGSFFVEDAGGKRIEFRYMKKEQNEESVWLYFEGRLEGQCTDTDSIKVGNTMLLDLYEDQKNLVIVTWGGEERGIGFDYQVREIAVQLHYF